MRPQKGYNSDGLVGFIVGMLIPIYVLGLVLIFSDNKKLKDAILEGYSIKILILFCIFAILVMEWQYSGSSINPPIFDGIV